MSSKDEVEEAFRRAPRSLVGTFIRIQRKLGENHRRYNRQIRCIRIPERPYRYNFQKPEEPDRNEYTFLRRAHHARRNRMYSRQGGRLQDRFQRAFDAILAYIP